MKHRRIVRDHFSVEPNQIVTLADGSIMVPALLGRTGILEYIRPDGSISRELKTPEALFDPESLASLVNCAVTFDHPAVSVTAENRKELAIGFVFSDVRAETPFIASSLVITDATMIARVRSTGDDALREISLGYECDVDSVSGTYQGLEYDAVHSNIRYNHVALLPRNSGRAGPTVGLRLDSKDQQMKIKVKRSDGSVIEVEQGSAEHIAALDLEIVNLSGTVKELQSKVDSESPAEIHRLAHQRAGILAAFVILEAAGKVKADKKRDEAPNTALQAELIAQIKPDFDLNGKSPDYIAAAYDLIVKPALAQMASAAPATGEMPEPAGDQNPMADPNGDLKKPENIPASTDGKGDSKDPRGNPNQINKSDTKSARERMIERNANAWRQPEKN